MAGVVGGLVMSCSRTRFPPERSRMRPSVWSLSLNRLRYETRYYWTPTSGVQLRSSRLVMLAAVGNKMNHQPYEVLLAVMGVLWFVTLVRQWRLRSAHSRLVEAHKQLRKRHATLENDQANMHAAHTTAKAELADISESNRRVAAAQSRLIAAQTQIEAELRALQDEYALLQGEHARVTSERDELRTAHDQLEPKYKASEAKQTALLERFRPIEDLGKEAKRLEDSVTKLKESYRQKKAKYDKLVHTVAAFDDGIELAELGFYEPHFDFDTSERYKHAIREIKEEQKEMVRNREAIVCNIQWTVDNSLAKGQTMINRGVRLTARAFNNECDAAVAKVRWNNVRRMELRIEKAFDAVNKANRSQHIVVTSEYLALKLQELRLAHEYKEKKHQEREEKAELRRQEREEAKLRKDAAQAAEEEAKYARLLAKARQEARSASPERLQALREDIATLTKRLEDAHSRGERALSMAQQTRSGYVYVISNVGSFGDAVYKIGMTRRLDPMDRVRELSAASVPFVYDTHAMVYSRDAPAMEAALHHAFDGRRVNKVNSRKEFFRVRLEEVKREIERLFPNADFVETIEARDFRETKSIEESRNDARSKTDARKKFPDAL
ncbi:MAG: chromosome partitioning protein ParA [Gemmatimonadetes bacterium]|nr:chromosome partitioning protein ParA [Gemmatimonadota bacterium]